MNLDWKDILEKLENLFQRKVGELFTVCG